VHTTRVTRERLTTLAKKFCTVKGSKEATIVELVVHGVRIRESQLTTMRLVRNGGDEKTEQREIRFEFLFFCSVIEGKCINYERCMKRRKRFDTSSF